MISEALRNASFIDPEDLSLKIRTSKTWKLDKDKKRVTSEIIDDLEAVKQAVFIHLNIENRSSFIHTNGFGIQAQKFFGMDTDLVMAKLPDTVKNALAWDERILDVTDFEFEKLNHKRILKFSCLITSCFGEFTYEGQVNVWR